MYQYPSDVVGSKKKDVGSLHALDLGRLADTSQKVERLVRKIGSRLWRENEVSWSAVVRGGVEGRAG